MLITRRFDSRMDWFDQRVVLEILGHPYVVAAINLSETGALVSAPNLRASGLVVGGVVKLTVFDERGHEKFSALGRAVRLNDREDGRTEIGIEFNSIDL